MHKPIAEICRVISSSEVLEDFDFEPLERTVHLAPTLSGRVFAIRGIASSDIDVVITDDFATPRDNRDVPVIIVAKKNGKFDGSVRDRILMRRFPGHQVKELSYGCLIADQYSTELDLAVISGNERLWATTYRVWTHELRIRTGEPESPSPSDP
jgi:hypothetical protein